jgi:hypothetical protein
MKTVIFLVACVIGVIAFPVPARASSIGHVTAVQTTCHSVTMSISIDSDWETSPNPNKVTYKVSQVVGASPPDDITSSNDSVIEIKGLQEWTPYYFVVEARSRHKNGWGIPLYRLVGELKFVTPHCNAISPVDPQPGDVRLRHELTGKCIFGNPVDGGPAKTFTCWKDPEMAISLESLGGSEVRIRLRAKGKCLYGDSSNGGTVKNFTCWQDPSMVYIMEDLGNNRYRLRHKLSGQCMYGSTGEAMPVHHWTCWNDPNMVWVKDPF